MGRDKKPPGSGIPRTAPVPDDTVRADQAALIFAAAGHQGSGMMEANIFEGFAELVVGTFAELKRRNAKN